MGVEVLAEVRVQLLVVVGGKQVGGQVGENKTKLMLYSTQLKLKLKFELSLATLISTLFDMKMTVDHHHHQQLEDF